MEWIGDSETSTEQGLSRGLRDSAGVCWGKNYQLFDCPCNNENEVVTADLEVKEIPKVIAFKKSLLSVTPSKNEMSMKMLLK